MAETIRFHNAKAFTGLTGRVDFTDAKIYGVSLITSNLEAEGHDLFVDDVTLHQLHSLGKEMVKIPVTQNHDGGIEDVNGWIENIRMDGNKLRGDWCLLKSHPETVTMLERADRQPSTFGLSLAFKGDPKGVLCNGKKCARAEKLLSADVVKRPAANPMGLFEARDVDKQILLNSQAMNQNTPNQPNGEPTIADLVAQISQLTEAVRQQGEIQSQLVEAHNSSIENAAEPELTREDLEQLYNATDEQLAELGISRADVDGAVAEFNASLEGGEGQEANNSMEGQQNSGEGSQAGLATAGAATGGSEGGNTAFNALQKQIIQLESKLKAREARELKTAEEIEFNEVRGKIAALVKQRDELLEFSERVLAEKEALEVCIRTGTRPVMAGVNDGVRLFAANDNGELHQFQALIQEIKDTKKCSEGQAILFASKQHPDLHQDWLASQKGKNLIRA